MKKLSIFAVENKNSGLWCNGNTTDSGPVFLGSNPGSPTKKLSNAQLFLCLLFFFLYLFVDGRNLFS